MPLVEHRPHGVYLDECAPHMRVRLTLVVAMVVGALLWLVLIFAAVALYRYLRGGA